MDSQNQQSLKKVTIGQGNRDSDNKTHASNILEVFERKIVRFLLKNEFQEYKQNSLMSQYKNLNSNTNQSKILQMSHNNEIFDVIQEFQDQIDVSKQQTEPLVKKQSFSSYETNSFLPQNFSQDDNSYSEEENKEKKCKNISKKTKTRTRKFNQNSKWTSSEQTKYWKFYVYYQVANPYEKISWIQWKRDSIYKTMAKYIGKQSGQCKSKDQNMKKKFLNPNNGNDVLDVAISKLQQFQGQNDEINQLLEEYHQLMSKNSDHMILLDKQMEIISQNQHCLDHLFQLF